jgi:hypothetical protein
LKILVLAALENILSVVSVIWFLPSITTRSGIHPLVRGKGVALLAGAGIVVKTGLLKNESRQLNRGFIKRMETGPLRASWSARDIKCVSFFEKFVIIFRI